MTYPPSALSRWNIAYLMIIPLALYTTGLLYLTKFRYIVSYWKAFNMWYTLRVCVGGPPLHVLSLLGGDVGGTLGGITQDHPSSLRSPVTLSWLFAGAAYSQLALTISRFFQGWVTQLRGFCPFVAGRLCHGRLTPIVGIVIFKSLMLLPCVAANATHNLPLLIDNIRVPLYHPYCYTVATGQTWHGTCHLAEGCGTAATITRLGHWYSASTSSLCLPVSLVHMERLDAVSCSGYPIGLYKISNEGEQIDRTIMASSSALSELLRFNNLLSAHDDSGFRNKHQRFLFPTELDLSSLSWRTVCLSCVYHNSTHRWCASKYSPHPANQGVRFVEYVAEGTITRWLRTGLMWLLTTGVHLVMYTLTLALRQLATIIETMLLRIPRLGHYVAINLSLMIAMRKSNTTVILTVCVLYTAGLVWIDFL